LRRKNENKKREKRGRNFGIVTIAEKRCVKRGRGGFLLYLGAKGDPSWMSSKCHTSKIEI
jgi:hypothetical protein